MLTGMGNSLALLRCKGISRRPAVLLALLWLIAGCQFGDPREKLPLYLDFETEADLDRVSWECGELFERTQTFASHGAWGLRLEMFPGAYPGIKVYKFDRDWRRYSSFAFDIFNPDTIAVQVLVRFDDQLKAPRAAQSQTALTVAPGAQTFSFRLDSLWNKERSRRLRKDHIEAVYLFLNQPPAKTVLYFDYLHLE